jgi:hypothetical protein
MSDTPTRRRFIRVTTAAALAGIAGCAGGEETTTDDSMGTETMGTDSMGTETEDGMGDDSMETETDEPMDDSTEDEMMAAATTFTIRVENVAPTDYYDADGPTGGAIWLTPGAFAVHTGDNPVFTPDEPASIGLEALAEAGPPTGFEGEDGLVTELSNADDVAASGAYTPADTVADPNDPMGEVPGAPPIAPEGAFEFEIEAEPGQHLSFASMFVPSNDAFVAPGTSGLALFEDEEPVEGSLSDGVHLWDAGTEPNEPPGTGEDQAPVQDSPDQGDDEGGVVHRLNSMDDGMSDGDYPAAADVVDVTVSPQ